MLNRTLIICKWERRDLNRNTRQRDLKMYTLVETAQRYLIKISELIRVMRPGKILLYLNVRWFLFAKERSASSAIHYIYVFCKCIHIAFKPYI